MSDSEDPVSPPAQGNGPDHEHSDLREDEDPEESQPHNDTQPIVENDDEAADDEADILSEIDENQFEDYDPDTANIEDRPVDIDEDVARTLKAARRKPGTAHIAKKPKEGRRQKKRQRDDDSSAADGDADSEAHRPRKARKAASGPRRSATPEPDDESLTPEERRKRALNRMIDEAAKSKVKRSRKKDEIDLEDEIDEKIATLKVQMERACEADNRARETGVPAVHKLKLLPEVVALLNRNNIQHAVLDPDTNFLQHVKFFLEPLNDGSLPAFNIQRDIFQALIKLPIEKEVLLSSGIGKVVLFYTRSGKPELAIKRMAERLLGEWSRPILKRTDDYKKRHVETRDFDYAAAKLAQRQAVGSQFSLAQRPARSERERLLAPAEIRTNRARITDMPSSYTVAPVSTFDGSRQVDHRPIGAGGIEAFRKMTQKGKKR